MNLQSAVEQLVQAWSSRRDDYLAACRSGTGSQSEPPPVEPMLNDLAQMFAQLARKELEEIRGSYFARGAAPANGPLRTIDYTPHVSQETPAGRDALTPQNTIDHTPASDAVEPEVIDTTGVFTPNAEWKNSLLDGEKTSRDFIVTPNFDVSNNAVTQSLGEAAAVATDKKRKPLKLPTIPGYEIQGVLGRGGMGVVYKAWQPGLKRHVALKMILKGEHASSSAIVRFLTEARAIAQINNPNIVQIYEINEYDDLPYFTLEFCAGGSLDGKLNKQPIAAKQAAEYAETLARALQVAHDAGVVHRDIKPSNVLIDAKGLLKVTDFGLARVTTEDVGLTGSNSVLGSPPYMSPEQAGLDPLNAGPASDQYSLGATLYEFITGRPPFQGPSAMETVKQVREKEPIPPRQLQPSCPKDLETICLKALSKEVPKRYASATALADDLRAFQEGRPISARPVGRVEQTWRWAKRNPRLASLIATVISLTIAMIVGTTVFSIVYARKADEAQNNFVDAQDKNTKLGVALNEVTQKKQESDENYQFARDNAELMLKEVPRLIEKQALAQGVRADFSQLIDEMLTGKVRGSVRALPDRMRFAMLQVRGRQALGKDDPQQALQVFQEALTLAQRLDATESTEKDKAYGHIATAHLDLAMVYHGQYFRNARIGQTLGGFNAVAVRLANRARSLVVTTPVNALASGAVDAVGTALANVQSQSPQLAASARKLAEAEYQKAETIQRERLQLPRSQELPTSERQQNLADLLFRKSLIAVPDPDFGGIGVRTRPDDVPPARKLLEEAIPLQKEVVQAPPSEGTKYRARPLLANMHYQMYRVLRLQAEPKLAEASLREAIAETERVVADDPSPTARLTLARRYRFLGDLVTFQGDRKGAEEFNGKSYQELRKVVVVPELQGVLDELASGHYRTGVTSLAKNPVVAQAHFQACLRLRETLQTYNYQPTTTKLKILIAAARCGQTSRAAALAKEVLAIPGAMQDTTALREVALAYSVCAASVGTGAETGRVTPADAATLKKNFTQQAVTLLNRILTQYQSFKATRPVYERFLETLLGDPDFDGIRDSAEFQAVVNTVRERR